MSRFRIFWGCRLTLHLPRRGFMSEVFSPCVSSHFCYFLGGFCFHLLSSHYSCVFHYYYIFIRNCNLNYVGHVVLPLRFGFSCQRDQKEIHFRVGPLTFAKPNPTLLMNIQNQEDNEQTCPFFLNRPRPLHKPSTLRLQQTWNICILAPHWDFWGL